MLFLEIIFFYLNYLLIDLYFNDFLSPVEILDNDLLSNFVYLFKYW